MYSTGQRPGPAQAVHYTAVLLRRWRLVLVLTVLGLVGALAYVTAAPKTFTATADVYVIPIGGDLGSQILHIRTGGGVDLDTEAQFVTSGTVATVAGHLMHSPLTASDLSQKVTVTVPAGSQVLHIACSTSPAAAAATCANDFAAAYLQNRTATATAAASARLTSLQGRVAALRRTVVTLGTEISAQPSKSATRRADESTLTTDKAQLRSLNSQITTLTGAVANVTGGRVITSATAPAKPSSPVKSLVLPSGVAAGLLIGLICAFVWDRRDKRLHTGRDVERLLDLPVLISLPPGASGRQASLASPRSRTGKAFTELAHTTAAALGEGSHILLVAGASPGPAASVIAANLAAALARTRSEAVLVCADLDDSVAPELFGLAGSRGLAEVVAGRATVGEVARGPAGVPGLWVIPPGADASLAGQHFQHDTAKALTAQLRRDARYVIIEAQATENGADTFALAEFADAALITIEANRTRRDEATTCIRLLHRMHIPLLGAAVLPPIAGSASIRPAQGQSRAGSLQDDRDHAITGRTRGESLGTSAAPTTGPSDRPARSFEGYGDPADDRVPGR